MTMIITVASTSTYDVFKFSIMCLKGKQTNGKWGEQTFQQLYYLARGSRDEKWKTPDTDIKCLDDNQISKQNFVRTELKTRWYVPKKYITYT